MDAKIRKFAVVVLILMLLVAGATQGSPALSQSVDANSMNGRIAFVSDRDSNQEIYVTDANGTGVIRLTNNSVDDFEPSWSPDGKRIVFVSNGGIDVMNADGTSITRLTNGPGNWEPIWSPDGREIAFISTDTGNEGIYVGNSDGTGVIRLTNNRFDQSPRWSPDGSKIAFMSDRDGDYKNSEIYTMNADGTELTNLTNNLAWDRDFAWSPDGGKIVFYSDRDGNYEIYIMNADGTGQTRLTNNTSDDVDPIWSPDGSKIAFTSWDRAEVKWKIYIMNTDGTGVTRLTNHLGDEVYPAWSPDGARIAFISTDTGNGEIYVVNADGTELTNLTNNQADDWEPAWEPTLRAWTLMFYMAGDNGEDMEEAISWELVTLREASYNRNVNLVIFRDGVDSEANYEVLSDGKEVVVASLGEVSTGDLDALGGFVKWARERYPAQHYALVIDDHGQGLGGVALDNHPIQGDWLGPKEMRQALEQAGKVDVIYMNACQMGNLESAYQLRGYADYYVAYEGIGKGPGDFGSMVETVSSSTEAEQLALSMAEIYFSRYPNFPSTVSVVRMSEVENVAAKTSALAGALRRHFVDGGLTLWNLTDASVLQRFDENSPANGIGNEDALADLYHFAWLVESSFSEQDIKTSAQELMGALESYVVKSWQRSGSVSVKGNSYDWSHGNAHGVSISCPRVVFCFYNYSWLDFAAGTKWPCPKISALSAADSVETIEWGPLMVDLVTTFNPNAPAITSPPEPIPLLQDVTEVYLPIVFSQR